MSKPTESTVMTELALWDQALEAALEARDIPRVMALARVVLKRVPRHLAAYFRLLQALWMERGWEEGEEWARRLLRADPTSELAWSMLAMAAEQRGLLPQARLHWARAFDLSPYDPIIRAGINRTAIDQADRLAITPAGLGCLYRRGRRWRRAVSLYQELVAQQPKRLDLLCGLLESLWQSGETGAAVALARDLTQGHPELLLAWIVLQEVGDETDQALAQAPLNALDAGYAYASLRYELSPRSVRRLIRVPPGDAALLQHSSPPA